MAIMLIAFAQTNAATVRTAVNIPDSLTVGDLFNLTVTIISRPQAQVVAPSADNGFGDITVREWTSDRSTRNGSDSLTFSYLLATYIPKPCSIPALRFVVLEDSLVDTLVTDPIPLNLISVLPSDTVDIRDLKPQHIAGRPSRWWLWLLCGIILAGTAGWYGYRWMKRRRKPATAPPPPPPYEEAMEALRELDIRNLVGQGLVREYVFRLSEILKRYIERRFGVNAQEFTTEEILEWLRHSSIDRSLRVHAEWFFSESDPVKFAKFLPDNDILKRMGAEVRGFVHETRPVIAPDETVAAKGTIVQPREGDDGGV